MTKMIKANEIKQGDVIHTEIYSTLWNRKIMTTAIVMEVTEVNGIYCVMAKAMDGFKEVIIERFFASEAAAKMAA